MHFEFQTSKLPINFFEHFIVINQVLFLILPKEYGKKFIEFLRSSGLFVMENLEKRSRNSTSYRLKFCFYFAPLLNMESLHPSFV